MLVLFVAVVSDMIKIAHLKSENSISNRFIGTKELKGLVIYLKICLRKLACCSLHLSELTNKFSVGFERME